MTKTDDLFCSKVRNLQIPAPDVWENIFNQKLRLMRTIDLTYYVGAQGLPHLYTTKREKDGSVLVTGAAREIDGGDELLNCFTIHDGGILTLYVMKIVERRNCQGVWNIKEDSEGTFFKVLCSTEKLN